MILFSSSVCHAHFGMIIPSDDIVTKNDVKVIELQIQFAHPFEGQFLNMEMPARFGVIDNGRRIDLISSIKQRSIGSVAAWKASYRIRGPGDIIFFVEPVPYWEPAEERFIIHYTKVIVNALGLERGWDSEVGLKTEIIPLTRPYGLWAGNVFQGVVKVDKRPSPHAEVEVEYYNEEHRVRSPSEPYVTQVVHADRNGIFTYAMPRAGWWGFAALSTADFRLKHNGTDYPVEIGAVIWVRSREMR